jgi:hypothetical protein
VLIKRSKNKIKRIRRVYSLRDAQPHRHGRQRKLKVLQYQNSQTVGRLHKPTFTFRNMEVGLNIEIRVAESLRNRWEGR